MPELLARDAAAFINQHGSSPCIGALRRAEGVFIEDVEGRRLLDLHGNSAHHIGYAHPRLVAALKDQVDRLVFSPRRYTNEPATLLAEALQRRFRAGRSKVLLTPGGSDAVEVALRLCRVATGRSAILALEDSYHGHGMGSLALSTAGLDPRLGSQLPDIHHVTPYWDDASGGAQRMLLDIERLFETIPGGAACLIAEPIRSNCVVPPTGMWPAVAGLCARHGVKLVFDEIPCGLGKTGRFFAHEHFGTTPDVVVLGKALGGGMLPIAAVIADEALDVAPELSLGHYTHEKNPLTARAALTVLEIIEDERLTERAERLSAFIRSEVVAERDRSNGLRRVRGLGLMLAIEVDPDGKAAAAPAGRPEPGAAPREGRADRIVTAALRRGVSTIAKGAHALGFSPPLTISEDEVGLALRVLSEAARETAAAGAA